MPENQPAQPRRPADVDALHRCAGLIGKINTREEAPEMGEKIVVDLPAGTVANLQALVHDSTGAGQIADVLATLADHAQQGVYRPGAWERGWLCQVFGYDWLVNLRTDTNRGVPDGQGGEIYPFDQPRTGGGRPDRDTQETGGTE